MKRRETLSLLGMAGLGALLPAAANATVAHSFDFVSIEGAPMPLSQWRCKVLLVVNTASFCGFTSQYEDLVRVWRDYEDQGLVVIGVPSQDFRQESSEEAEIKSFCELTFGVDFPMTELTSVKGAEAHPFFRWARETSGRGVRWNFNKYLIGRDGHMVTWMPSTLKPNTPKARAEIEAALAAPCV